MGLTAPSVAGCLPTLVNYKEFFGKNYPALSDKGDTSTLQMFKSADNTAGLKQLSDYVTGVPGKTRGVRMQYREPVCVEVCSTEFSCTETRMSVTAALKTIDYSIDTRWHPCSMGVPAELTLTAAQFKQYCMVDNQEEFKQMQMEFDLNFIHQTDIKVLQAIQAKVLPDNTKSKNFFITSMMGGNSVLNDAWLLEVMQTLQADGKSIDDYMMLGGMFMLYLKLKYTGFVTTSTEGGVSQGINLPPTYFDKNFDTVFGATHSFLLIPKGAFQLVQWIENVEGFRDERFISSTKLIPLGNGKNITVDYTWEYDPKCKIYKYMPYTYMEVPLAYSQNCANAKENNIYLFNNCSTIGLPNC